MLIQLKTEHLEFSPEGELVILSGNFIHLLIPDTNELTQYLEQFVLIILVKINATFATQDCDVTGIEIQLAHQFYLYQLWK